MYIGFEEDISVDELVEAFQSVADKLKELGVTRLPCVSITSFAWKNKRRH